MPTLKTTTYKSLIIVLLACSKVLSAQAPIPAEYEVKAAFLFNFTQFVEWPPSSFASDQAPLVIGVFGNNPFGSYLEDMISGEKIKGHSLAVYYCKNTDDIKACHILFVNKDKVNEMGDIMSKLNGKNVLTVSDAPDFLQQGGMIQFYNMNNKINLQVNLDAAKAAKLDISSKMLRLCKIFVAK